MLTINNTLDGYLKDVEIKGNTIQDTSNLADIKSVGDKVEGQELYEIPVLSCNERYSHVVTYDDSRIDFVFNEFLVGGVTIVNKSDKPIRPILLNENGSYVSDGSVNAGSTYVIPNGNKVKKISLYAHQGWTISNDYVMDDVMAIEGAEKHKITILSPTPLEKVGDVRDKIIEKDGVWGVEKNVGVLKFKEYTQSLKAHLKKDSVYRFSLPQIINTPSTSAITTFGETDVYSKDIEGVAIDKNAGNVFIQISYTNLNIDINSSTTQQLLLGATFFIERNNVEMLYIKSEPQFIPLPHDQQVKLRTFAGKTNISFLTEIEGTIKAQVPKSLGATVNTHTEQISNLNKELDRVKKLEESTVSTVETESDFTTVEATSNGYFEDVKLEGKTLVNKFIFSHTETVTDSRHTIIAKDYRNITNIKVTIVNLSTKPIWVGTYNSSSDAFVKAHKIEANSSLLLDLIGIYLYNIIGYIADGWTSADELKPYALWVEGDHTQNPPSYFEGLKSVGQDVDEIVVSSVKGDGNLISSECKVGTLFEVYAPKGEYVASCKSKQCTIRFYRKDKTLIDYWSLSGGEIIYRSFTTQEDIYYVLFDGDTNTTDIQLIKGSTPKPYVPYQTDKKRLLYYNEETQTWEKPILRQWDSIEKHSDGKYYYHQRSAEVVLNGSENWSISPGNSDITTSLFYYRIDDRTPNSECICDKFTRINGHTIGYPEGIYYGADINIRISTSKLSTQDAQGFKQWLQANNVTVVYQLAQEKVYECANIDLITYANETNYIVESGAIAPKSTLKVHNNISNVVSLLQKKVSLLESNMTKYMITQNRMQLASTYSADSVTFKVDYFSLCGDEENYDEDLYNLILNNILVGKDNYDYDKMFTMILDYASWNQISWEQFDILVGLMDIQHNPPIEEIPTDDEIVEEIPNEIM